MINYLHLKQLDCYDNNRPVKIKYGLKSMKRTLIYRTNMLDVNGAWIIYENIESIAL